MSEATVRVALYIKATTTDKADRREADLRTAAAHTPGWTIVAVFTDLGPARRRPALQQAFTAAQAREFDLLLVDSIQDLTGTPHLSVFVEQFQEHHVRVRSLAERFDSSHLLAKVILAHLDVLTGHRLDRMRRGREHTARPIPARTVPAPSGSRASTPGAVVTVQALYQAVSDDRLPWLDDLLGHGPGRTAVPRVRRPPARRPRHRRALLPERTVTARSKPATLTRVAIYLRAGSMELAADESAALLTLVGSTPDWRIVAVFCDITGGPARPARTGAVAAAQAGGFDLLLVTGLDRLTRSTDELHDLIGQFTATNVLVCCLGIRPTSPARHDRQPELLVVTGTIAGRAVHQADMLTAVQPALALADRPAAAGEEQ